MDLDKLKVHLEAYHSTIAKTDQYRKDWLVAKNLIYDSLTMIIEKTGMRATLAKEERLDGMELIYLGFPKRESGISERFGGLNRPFMKDGGFLFYTQIYNGKVSVWISLPVIENFVEQQAPAPLAICEPSEIKEDLVVRHVAEFLKTMALWEDQDMEHHEIGYKIRGKNKS